MQKYLNNCIVGWTQRFHVADNSSVLSATSSLLSVPVIELHRPEQRLPERNLGFAHYNRAVVLPGHSLSVNFQMKLTHSRGYRFLHVVVKPYPCLRRNVIHQITKNLES